MTAAAKLPQFEDHDVASAAVRIVKCGDGLSEALRVEPRALQLGDIVSFVLTGVVTQINHRDKDDVVTRLHTVETTAIAEVDKATANKMLASRAEEIEKKRAQIDGQLALDSEAAAEQAEADDANLPADEIAAKAAERSKRPTA